MAAKLVLVVAFCILAFCGVGDHNVGAASVTTWSGTGPPFREEGPKVLRGNHSPPTATASDNCGQLTPMYQVPMADT